MRRFEGIPATCEDGTELTILAIRRSVMEFTDDELEILSWALDDHVVKILTRAEAFGYVGGVRRKDGSPNLAYLDTMIIKNRIEAERERRQQAKLDQRGVGRD